MSLKVHEAILPRTFVRVRPSQRRTRTKVRVCVYVVHVYDVQKYEIPSFR